MNKIVENFFKRLAQTTSRRLFLDYDGTIAPFRQERDRAYPYDGIEQRLDRLIGLSKTIVTIVTGRAIKDIKPLLRLKKYPEIWGSHGWEYLDTADDYRIMERSPEQLDDLQKAHQYILKHQLGQYLEEKPVSLAIHFRGVDPDKILEIRSKILYNWDSLVAGGNLIWDSFDGGMELKIPGFDKGNVVDRILRNSPSKTVSAYLGDDLTDEDAFKALPSNGLGLLVRDKYRKTAAAAWIQPPHELYNFLDRWIEIDE
nr:trehalose-phosphatase [candidate division Zixibacteria bacterium]